MSDELTQAPDEVQDTPAADAAPEGTPAPGTEEQANYEQRYNDLRPKWTQATQRLSEFEDLRNRAKSGDRDAFNQLLEGAYQLPDDEVPDLEDGEQEAFQDPRVDTLLQERAAEREQAVLNDVSGHIDTLLGEAKVELPPRLKNAILSEAWLRGGGAQIKPETTQEVVKEWIDEYKALEQAAGDRRIQSKKNAPYVSPGGTGATQTPFRDDMSLDERIAAAQEQARLISGM